MVCSYASLRDDRQMARRPASNVQRQRRRWLGSRVKRERANGARPFSSQAELVLRGCGLSCCAGCIQLDACPHSYSDRQRRVDCSGLRAGCGASAGCSAVGHARTSCVACAGRKRCCANQFSSAVFAALACAMLTLVVAELLVTASCFAAPRRRNKAARQRQQHCGFKRRSALLIFAPAVGAGLLMAFSRTLWSYATITEVYTLNALLILLSLLSGAFGGGGGSLQTRTDSSVAGRDHMTAWIYAAAFVFGLGDGCSSRDRGVDASGHCRSRLQDRGSEVLHEPTPFICCADFDRRVGPCL